jgi:hypothetical protein
MKNKNEKLGAALRGEWQGKPMCWNAPDPWGNK